MGIVGNKQWAVCQGRRTFLSVGDGQDWEIEVQLWVTRDGCLSFT